MRAADFYSRQPGANSTRISYLFTSFQLKIQLPQVKAELDPRYIHCIWQG